MNPLFDKIYSKMLDDVGITQRERAFRVYLWGMYVYRAPCQQTGHYTVYTRIDKCVRSDKDSHV